MGATHDPIGHRCMCDLVLFKERGHFRIDLWVLADISNFNEPFPHVGWLWFRARKNRDYKFGRLGIVRAVGRNRGQGIFFVPGNHRAKVTVRQFFGQTLQCRNIRCKSVYICIVQSDSPSFRIGC